MDSTKEMLMGDQSNSEQSKAVVDAYYQAGVEGHLTDFARYLHPDLRQRNFGITGSDAMIKISEHWTVKKRQGHLDLGRLFRAADPA